MRGYALPQPQELAGWHSRSAIRHSPLPVAGECVNSDLERVVRGVHGIVWMRFRMRVFYRSVDVVIFCNLARVRSRNPAHRTSRMGEPTLAVRPADTSLRSPRLDRHAVPRDQARSIAALPASTTNDAAVETLPPGLSTSSITR